MFEHTLRLHELLLKKLDSILFELDNNFGFIAR